MTPEFMHINKFLGFFSCCLKETHLKYNHTLRYEELEFQHVMLREDSPAPASS